MSGDATQHLLKNGEAKKHCRDPTVKTRARVQTAEPKLDLFGGSEARLERDD